MNNGMNELMEYKQYENEIREGLETEYALAMYNNDLGTAYNIIGKMMDFKMIDVDDPRIEKNNKSFKAAGISKDHRFVRDYRKDMNYMPSWLFGRLEGNKRIQCNTIEHWGKRVEGNYEGDVIFKSVKVDIRISLCTSSGQAGGVGTILAAQTQNPFLYELINSGVYRVYQVEIVSVSHYMHRNIGYIVVQMTDNGIVGNMFPNYDTLLYNWLPVRETLMGIAGATQNMIGGVVNLATSWDKAIAEQTATLNAGNAAAEIRNKAVRENKEREEREKAAKAAEKAAALKAKKADAEAKKVATAAKRAEAAAKKEEEANSPEGQNKKIYNTAVKKYMKRIEE